MTEDGGARGSAHGVLHCCGVYDPVAGLAAEEGGIPTERNETVGHTSREENGQKSGCIHSDIRGSALYAQDVTNLFVKTASSSEMKEKETDEKKGWKGSLSGLAWG
jgi:hypothetical protein